MCWRRRCSGARIARPPASSGCGSPSTRRMRCSSSPPTTASPSFPGPTPVHSRWRCGRCSASAAWTCSPGKISAGAGWPTSSASSSRPARACWRPTTASARPRQRRLRSRRGLHLERHGGGCARAGRQLDRRRPPRSHLRRCHVGAVRAGRRLAQDRRRHFLLAEGARRGSGARHDRAVAARASSGCSGIARAGRFRSCSASPRMGACSTTFSPASPSTRRR